MRQVLTLFISTFTTLLAIVNPFEALPIFLKLLQGEDDADRRQIARLSCLYAALLLYFFLFFGELVLKIFGVPLSMVRIVGGIILCRVGFELFGGSASSASLLAPAPGAAKGNLAFVPLAMPIMCGPGAIATTLGMTSLIRNPQFQLFPLLAIVCAISACMLVTYLCLVNAHRILGRIGPRGIDAVTRIVGFFLSAVGMGLVFHGVIEGLRANGVLTMH
jgi:multiple antibiotic resistance protein